MTKLIGDKCSLHSDLENAAQQVVPTVEQCMRERDEGEVQKLTIKGLGKEVISKNSDSTAVDAGAVQMERSTESRQV